MQYQKILDTIQEELSNKQNNGKVASYIPELAKVDPNKFGMHLYCISSGHYGFGNEQEQFSIQSISKVFSLTLAMSLLDDELFERVDVEPSGDPFNSLVQLEYENGIPRNPLINSGALVIADVLVSTLENPKKQLLEFIRKISGNTTIDVNSKVFKSEMKYSHRNASLLHLMKSFGNIKNDIETVLDLYIYQCSIAMSCKELATAFMVYANSGRTLFDEKQVISERKTKRINAIMQTCGFYDEAGEFSFRVGLPGKSGVGGGIAAIHPGQYAVTTWSPPLNPKGNSELGMYALERLTTLTGFSIF
ncbi:glutaminase [Aquimarina sp. AD1]|uniref:glutaminase n=1 Tax=Aquimarina sp. (strain AD1) TaxID=1714848 RepID=UPI000E4A983E|nr:glutaminase [Aquimarina sp. AD1]AXT58313.1 glutaminase [Aquimarina sp. AD1]RKN25517.1 glutaminase [Aquimarina sp. AD1]